MFRCAMLSVVRFRELLMWDQMFDLVGDANDTTGNTGSGISSGLAQLDATYSRQFGRINERLRSR